MRIAVVALLSILALSPSPPRAEEVAAFADPSRLISIGGSLTEIVYALEAEHLLVARDSTGTYPPAAADLPDVGYMRALAPEGVLSLQPTAILMLAGAGPVETIDVLHGTSVPIVVVPEAYDREGVLAKVRIVGAALGLTDRAEALAAQIEAEFDAIATLTAALGRDERRTVLFVLSMAGGRINASGTGTAADGIIRMAGAENAITAFEGYRQLSDEAIIGANPDAILMMSQMGDHGIGDRELLAHPGVSMTAAGRTGAIIRMDGSYLLSFGPRTASAARDLADAVYGEGG